MAVPEGTHHLRPIPRLLCIPPSGCLCSLPQSADGSLHVPPPMRLLQRKHVADPQLIEGTLELPILAVKGVRNHSPEGHAPPDRTLHQLAGYLQLGAEIGIVVATFEVGSTPWNRGRRLS